MQTIAFKMLFRKKGTASAIIAITLLIALLTSVNCLVNNINAQTTLLTGLASLGNTYVVTSRNSTSLSDSQLNVNILSQIKNDANTKYATAQLLWHVTLATQTGNFSVTARGVDDVQTYLKQTQASINGSAAKTATDAEAGVILANIATINKNDQVTLTVNEKSIQLKIVGITRAQQQSDSQLILPLATLQQLTGVTQTVSIVEFSIKDTHKASVTLANFTQALPPTVKITSTQQVTAFASDINNQTVNFIGIWSIAVYAVVVAASFVIATRAINEAQYDLYTLRTLGAKKKASIYLVLTYVLTVAFVGTFLGLSLGIVGTQLASTALRWAIGNSQLAPFLEVNQAFTILILSLASSAAGAIYPAVKGVQTIARENPL
jgi:ABC-type lipoprotein release transport system permease subunit